MSGNHHTRLSFRVKPIERHKILSDAKAIGMSVGSYIRSKLLEVVVTAATYKRTQTRRLIMHLIGHIGRVGNNMNQIAHKLNLGEPLTNLDRHLHEEGIAILKEIRALLIDLLLNGTC